MTDYAADLDRQAADLPAVLERLALQVGSVATELVLDRRSTLDDRRRAQVLGDAQRRLDDCARLVRDLRARV